MGEIEFLVPSMLCIGLDKESKCWINVELCLTSFCYVEVFMVLLRSRTCGWVVGGCGYSMNNECQSQIMSFLFIKFTYKLSYAWYMMLILTEVDKEHLFLSNQLNIVSLEVVSSKRLMKRAAFVFLHEIYSTSSFVMFCLKICLCNTM